MQVSTHLKILAVLLILSGVSSAACYLHTTFITGSEGALSKEAHDCDDGGIVANNPTNPEMAGMEVTDARLVNLPEKTHFNISKVIEAPDPPGAIGGLSNELRINNLAIVNPELGPLLGDDGVWTPRDEHGNGDPDPVFRFAQLDPDPPHQPTGVVYNSLDEVPRPMSSTPEQWQATKEDIAYRVEIKYKPNFIEKFLKTLTPQNTRIESIFQLDPNQLLTVSGGYKVVLRRPLPGFFNSD